MRKIAKYGLSLLFVSSLLAACTDDDPISNGRYDDGYLHFKFTFDNKDGAWNEDGISETRAVAPLPVTSSIELGEPLYLHTEISPTVTPTDTTKAQQATRGKRYTGHVFENGINNLQIYGTIGSEVALPFGTTISISDMTGTDGNGEADWRVNEEQEIETSWGETETGNFYAVAPAIDSNVKCVTYDSSDPTTLTFTMQASEPDNIDLLTSKALGVTYENKNGDGVELPFKHIMTAIKFNLNTSDALTCTIDNTTYYIQVKQVKLMNILSEGTFNIATETWTPGSAMASCTTTITKEYTDIAADNAINTDENCLMVMPQTIPNDAMMRMICDLTTNADGTGTKKENVSFDVKIGGLDGTNPTSWAQGTTYTYKVSKMAYALNYNFSSKYNNQLGGSLTFSAAGGTLDMKIISTIEKVTGTTTTIEAMPWHIEYSADDGNTWTSGLPEGFRLLNHQYNEVTDLLNIPGNAPEDATTEYTWRLVGRPNLPELTSVTQLKQKEYGAESAPLDLSLYDAAGNVLSGGQSSANCYVVHGYGHFKFPLYYGNAIKNGVTNNAAYSEYTINPVFVNCEGKHIMNPNIETDTELTADEAIVGWEDTEDEVIDRSSLHLTTENGVKYVNFAIKKDAIQPVNALIAVRCSGKVMWSWHIWVTNLNLGQNATFKYDNHNYTFLKYTLGWSSPEYVNTTARSYKFRVAQNSATGGTYTHPASIPAGEVAIGGSNYIYQFGRKDPFPINAPVGVRGSVTDENKFTLIAGKKNTVLKPQRVVSPALMSTAIKNPTTAYKGGSYSWMYPHNMTETRSETDWAYATTWAPKKDFDAVCNIKTVYDPCPVGYVIPTANALKSLLAANDATLSYKSDLPVGYQKVTSKTSGDSFDFFLIGRMNTTSNDATAYTQNFNSNGYLWSGTVSNPLGEGFYLNATSSGITNGFLYQGWGLSVLPVTDENYASVEAFSPIGKEIRSRVTFVGNNSTYTFSNIVINYYKSLGATSVTVKKVEAYMAFTTGKTTKGVKGNLNCGTSGTLAFDLTKTRDITSSNNKVTEEITLTNAQKTGLANLLWTMGDTDSALISDVVNFGTNVRHFYITLEFN